MSTVNYTSLLGLALPTQGDLSGQWGTEVNNYITTYLDSAVAGQLAISLTGNLTLTKTTGSSLGSTSSQYAILNVTPSASTWTITVPAASKTYYINNLSSTYTFTIKASGQTGFVVAAAEKCVVAYNGTDFVRVGSTSVFGAPSTAMTINTSGNIGVGVTPSAWSQGQAIELQNPGYGIWNGSGAPASMYMLANAYYNSGFKYGGTGQASHYYQYLGQHVWSTAVSGTAGNAITFTQAMTLDSSGNLGLGVTPSAWGSSIAKVLEFSYGSFTSSNGLGLVNALNAYYNSGWKYTNASAAAMLYNQTGGGHYWSVAPTNPGAAGTAITFTQAMALDSSSNLYVAATYGALNGRIIFNKAGGNGSLGATSVNDTSVLDTGISINQSNQGCCLLLLASRNTSSGTNTDAAVYIIRFYFDGNNAPTTTYVGGSSNFVIFGVSGSNTLTVQNASGGNSTYSWFGNK
jgi:hypothetical protein